MKDTPVFKPGVMRIGELNKLPEGIRENAEGLAALKAKLAERRFFSGGFFARVYDPSEEPGDVVKLIWDTETRLGAFVEVEWNTIGWEDVPGGRTHEQFLAYEINNRWTCHNEIVYMMPVRNESALVFDGGEAPGGVIFYTGLITNIPPGWVLCDGNNGTEDMRDRFVVGAGNNYAVGDTGGNDVHGASANGHGSFVAAAGADMIVSQDQGDTDNRPIYFAVAYIMRKNIS